MSKKLTVIGKGSVGALTVSQFLFNTDWDIDWVFDENIPVASVGEASNLVLSRALKNLMNFQHKELLEMGGTVKQGIMKKNWGSKGDFFHPFPIDTSAIHFTAFELHKILYDKIKENRRVKIINKHIDNFEAIESDFIIVCSGTPKDLKTNPEFQLIDSIPVNSAFVTQCEWESPRFTYSLTNAMKHGWIFGIPLQKRISIGYLYNDNISSLEDVKKDLKNVFKDYSLNPSEETNHLKFTSFYRKNNFTNKIAYNGNASFFLEPLEATSLGFSHTVNIITAKLWNNEITIEEAQKKYEERINHIKLMILLHYASGSSFQENFWKISQKNALSIIKEEIKNKTEWSKFVYKALNNNFEQKELGTWGPYNYNLNIENLGLKEKIIRWYEED